MSTVVRLHNGGKHHKDLPCSSCHRPSFLSNDFSPSRMLQLETEILVCDDTGLIQHESPLSDDLFLFTLPIWGTDLHCDSRLFPFPLPQGLGYEVRYELTETPEPKATGTEFLEGKRRELWYESGTRMRPSPWENQLGLSSLC